VEAGLAGLYDRTWANPHVAQRIPPELERTLLSIRRRPQVLREQKEPFLAAISMLAQAVEQRDACRGEAPARSPRPPVADR
jgi:hypothetical protein